jgi:hypothetical protein
MTRRPVQGSVYKENPKCHESQKAAYLGEKSYVNSRQNLAASADLRRTISGLAARLGAFMHDTTTPPPDNKPTGRQPMSKNPSISRLLSVDDTIDDIASAALDEARRAEEGRKYRCNPGPILPPNC